LNKDPDNRTLPQLVEEHNSNFEARIGTDYTFSTYEKYDILRSKLVAFIPQTYQKKDIQLKDLTAKHVCPQSWLIQPNFYFNP